MTRLAKWFLMMGLATAFCAGAAWAATGVLRLASLDPASTTLSSTVLQPAQGGAMRISAPGPVSVCLGQVDGLTVDGCRLLYTARVKSQALAGRAFLEMWLHFADGSIYFSRGMQSYVSGDQDWKELNAPFLLQKGQKPVKATLNLAVVGSGTVWVEELRLDRLPLD